MDFVLRTQRLVEVLDPRICDWALTDEDNFHGAKKAGDVREIGDSQAIDHLDGWTTSIDLACGILSCGR